MGDKPYTLTVTLDHLERWKAIADRRLELLRRMEWCKWDGIDFVSHKCPYCGNYKQQRHMAGCELAKELGDDRLEA